MFKKPEQIKPLPSGMADAFSKTLERQGFKAPAPVQVQPTVVAVQPQVVSEAAPAMNRIADKKEAPEKAKMVKMKDKVEAVESESCECGDDAEYDSKGMCESCGKPHAEGYSESFSPKEVKMAIGVASDKRYAGGNMSGASKAIDKIKKGLSSHPQVAAVLKRQNEELDTVNTKALKKDFSDRKDKDIDNDGDSDSSDEYLHKRRKAISKALASEAKMTPDQMKKALADDKAKAKPKGQVTLKKAPWDMKKEEVQIDEAISGDQYYYVDPKGVVVAVGNKDSMRKMNMKQAKDGNKGGSFSQNRKKYKVGDKINESVKIDEISMTKMAAYAPKAVKSRNDAKAATHSADSNRVANAKKVIAKRKAGADNYNKKMWGYGNVAPTKESVELDEKSPAIKQDNIKVIRTADKAHSDAMGRTPAGRKKPTKAPVVEAKVGPSHDEIMKAIGNTQSSAQGMAILQKKFKLTAAQARKHMDMFLKDDVQIDEKAGSFHNPKKDKIVDSKKFDVYKKHMKTHNLDEPTVRMAHDNPDHGESKRMMKNPKYSKGLELYKASMKEATYSDTGWKKPEVKKDKFGNVIKDKNVAKNLAKSAMKSFKDIRKK